MADISIVMLVPGTGDDVQAIKAGIMEIADIFVVNKADRDGADALVHAVAANLSLQAFAAGEWQPPILKTQATTGAGMPELWHAIVRFREQSGERRAERQRVRHDARLRDLVARQLLAHVERTLGEDEWRRLVDDVASRALDPYAAAAAIVRRIVATPS
jgi:LAO/AO transport system kinase